MLLLNLRFTHREIHMSIIFQLHQSWLSVIQDPASLGAPCDILLELKSGFFKQISDTSPAYQPLAYPLLFPYGESGWHPNIPIQGVHHAGGLDDNQEQDDDDDDGESTSRHKTVSLLEYYVYRLHPHPPEIESQHYLMQGSFFSSGLLMHGQLQIKHTFAGLVKIKMPYDQMSPAVLQML
jgi:hypothetical protein